jgi:hypothetical protein
MWLIASMVMTRTFDWPKNSEMTAYEQTGPGQIATLIGSSAVPRRRSFRTALYPKELDELHMTPVLLKR